jgi:hypothetical protein
MGPMHLSEMIAHAHQRHLERQLRKNEELQARLRTEASLLLERARLQFGMAFEQLTQAEMLSVGLFRFEANFEALNQRPAIRIKTDRDTLYLFNPTLDQQNEWLLHALPPDQAGAGDGTKPSLLFTIAIVIEADDPDASGDCLLLAIDTLLQRLAQIES